MAASRTPSSSARGKAAGRVGGGRKPRRATSDAKVSGDTRERILYEASLLFGQNGYRGTSTRDIARAVGIRQPSLFHHFDSKPAILRELLRSNLEEPPRFAEKLSRKRGPAAPRLYCFLHWDLLGILRSPYNLAGIYTEDLLHDREFEDWWGKMGRLFRSIERLVAQGVAAGEFIEIDPTLAQTMIAGLTHSLIRAHGGGEVPDGEARADAAAAFVLRGLLRDPGRLDAVRAAAAEL